MCHACAETGKVKKSFVEGGGARKMWGVWKRGSCDEGRLLIKNTRAAKRPRQEFYWLGKSTSKRIVLNNTPQSGPSVLSTSVQMA